MLAPANDDPVKQLEGLLEALLFGPDDPESFQTAMLELRSQAPYKKVYRKQFQTNDKYIRDVFSDIIKQGSEEGTFRSVDPDQTAAVFLPLIEEVRMRRIILENEEVLKTIADNFQCRIEDDLLINPSPQS